MSTATDVVKSVNIRIAVRWVAKAWSMVKAENVSRRQVKTVARWRSM